MPHPVNLLELALRAQGQGGQRVSCLKGYEGKRADPITCPPWGGMCTEVMLLYCFLAMSCSQESCPQLVKYNLGAQVMSLFPVASNSSQETWSLGHESERAIPVPSLDISLKRVDPGPHLGSTVKLALTAKAQVSQLKGYENRKAGPAPHRLLYLGVKVLNLDLATQ